MPAAAPKELDYAQKEQLREAFDLFDVDKSGAIDMSEMRTLLADVCAQHVHFESLSRLDSPFHFDSPNRFDTP